ncbi:M24 family metallopeptidase [Bacillus salitolerans]|uniref:M24 family metallopeptidase n=1 Tax=Bacillus salitolerans TaxID=1437434 RepID=A0ABW4LP79_9BACI
MQQSRIEKLRTKMKECGLDAVFVSSIENRYYFSNFRGSAGNLFITAEKAMLLTDFRYVDQAKEDANLYEVIDHNRDLFGHVKQLAENLHVNKLGLEYEFISAEDYLSLRDLLGNVQFETVDSIFYDIRMIKDDEEIRYLEEAVSYCDGAFEHILTFIKPGMTEKEVGLELEFFMRKAGAEGIKANHVIASGERSSLPHGQATDRVIQVGDFVKMDIGAKVRGYYSDFTRTVVVGEPSMKQLEIYGIVHRAQLAALDAIGPGKVCSELDEVARSIIRDAGYGDNFGHSLGHSIGLAVHEKPAMRHTDHTILQPGMVMTVEPGIYIPGFGGVRIEDFVVITEDGYRNLTKATKDLQVLSV